MNRYECQEGTSNKFWQWKAVGNDLIVQFGKLGTQGQESRKTFADPKKAAAAGQKLAEEKIRKGYKAARGNATAVSTKATTKSPATAKSSSTKVAKGSGTNAAFVEPKELAAFRAEATAKKSKAFFRDPDFGEVKLLAAGSKSGLQKHSPDLPWDLADWIAEEADGDVIGYLRVSSPTRPVVVMSNEGSAYVSGLCLVDHFTARLGDGDGAEFLDCFCEKHGLPFPRDVDATAALIRKTGLGDLDRGITAKLVSKLNALKTPTAKAELKSPKSKSVAAGKPNQLIDRPLSPYLHAAWFEGAAWIVMTDRANKRTLLRVTGDVLQKVRDLPDGAYVEVAGDRLAFASDSKVWFISPNGELSKPHLFGKTLPKGGNIVSVEGILYLYGATEKKKRVSGEWKTKSAILRWDGQVFVNVATGIDGDLSVIHFGKDEAIYVTDDDNPNRRVDLRTGKTSQLGTPPKTYGTVVGTVGDKFAYRDTDDAYFVGPPWKKVPGLNNVKKFVSLGGNRVLLFAEHSTELRILDARTLKVVRVGNTQLKRPNAYAVCIVPTSDHQVLICGGYLGIKKETLCEPELFDLSKGTSTALKGGEAALKAQVALQKKGYRGY